MKVDLIQSIGRVSRINLNKIFSTMESHSRSSSACSTTTAATNHNQDNIPLTPTKIQKSSVKRNLFGKLNHDLLKNDLKEMWKETRDRQKLKWNFDFENLCPTATTSTTTTTTATTATTSKVDENNRYEWSNINESSLPEFYTCTHAAYNARKYRNRQTNDLLTAITQNTHAQGASSSYPLASATLFNQQSPKSKRSHSDESEDISSSSDLDEQHHEQQKPVKFEPIFQMQLRNSCIKPTPKRRYTKKSSPEKQLIITTSENRKDTLRSASKLAKVDTAYKQQTLFDMLKQRKRRVVDLDTKKQSTLFLSPTTKQSTSIQHA
jgi:hypothetical protein